LGLFTGVSTIYVVKLFEYNDVGFTVNRKKGGQISMKKTLSIVLSAMLISTVLAGCAAKQPVVKEPVKSEPVEITVINAAGGTPNFGTGDPIYDENPIAKDILEKLNIKIKWEALTGDGKQQMGLKLASGEYGDVIVNLSPDIYTKMMADKMIQPIDSHLDKVGADIKKAYGPQTLNAIKESDGKTYHLVNSFGNIPEGIQPPGYGFGFQLRKDIYEALGKPKLETLDDVYSVLKMIKKDPKLSKNDKGESVWPIGTFKRSWYNMIQALEAMGGSGTSKWTVVDGKIEYWFKAPWALDVIKFYNTVYREGLLDPESFTIDPDAWQKNKVNTGRIASTIGSWYMVADAWGQFKTANVPNAENMWYMNFAITVPNGEKPQLVGVTSIGGGSTVITDKCKNPEAVIKLMNYFASPEGNFAVLNGAEGTQWDMKDGKPVIKDEFLKRWQAGESDPQFAKETGLGIYNKFVGTDVGRSPWGTYWILKDDPTISNRADFAQRDEALGKYFFDAAPFVNVEAGLPDDINMKYSTIEGKLNDAIYGPILAKTPEACVSEWNKFLKAMDDAGAVAVEEAVSKNYENNLKKLGK